MLGSKSARLLTTDLFARQAMTGLIDGSGMPGAWRKFPPAEPAGTVIRVTSQELRVR
jgi:hypothetical protein